MLKYELLRDSYKKLLEETEEENKEAIEKKIKVYEFLAECSEDDIPVLYNSGAFNRITKGYCEKAMQQAGLSDAKIQSVLCEISNLHDTFGAENLDLD